MKTSDKEQVQRDISKAFDFVRFLIKKPQMLKKIKDGSEICFVPAASSKIPRSSRMSKKVQVFTTELVFHTL
jgi:hypothetical protein